MPLQRFSSCRGSLYAIFLGQCLGSAVNYDRIAGNFQSSMLGLASDQLKSIHRFRIVCNTEVNPADVHAVRQATGSRRTEIESALLRMVWNSGQFPNLADVYGDKAKARHPLLQSPI
jgi:hypothetical protein